jgi:hypothetical protein
VKKLIIIITLCLHTLIHATADPRFELGFIAGYPTGISMKWWHAKIHAFDLTTGWSFSENGKFDFQFDYLLHPFRINFKNGEMPFYFGIGPYFQVRDGAIFGARIPVGFDYLLKKAPLSIFIEAAARRQIVPERRKWSADGGLGMRIQF